MRHQKCAVACTAESAARTCNRSNCYVLSCTVYNEISQRRWRRRRRVRRWRRRRRPSASSVLCDKRQKCTRCTERRAGGSDVGGAGWGRNDAAVRRPPRVQRALAVRAGTRTDGAAVAARDRETAARRHVCTTSYARRCEAPGSHGPAGRRRPRRAGSEGKFFARAPLYFFLDFLVSRRPSRLPRAVSRRRRRRHLRTSRRDVIIIITVVVVVTAACCNSAVDCAAPTTRYLLTYLYRYYEIVT